MSIKNTNSKLKPSKYVQTRPDKKCEMCCYACENQMHLKKKNKKYDKHIS